LVLELAMEMLMNGLSEELSEVSGVPVSVAGVGVGQSGGQPVPLPKGSTIAHPTIATSTTAAAVIQM